ncbi:hypothetical protein [Gloeothece verrucosa]|uniref:Uncharacterized protein n=1 Tax=Gloeothece verrucosa (strain PCC 7822) TaxID=497965 RepID=E0UMN5_GLOV7|nr:hypothetical protein [Gloeothece verrucosa]ADN18215.1 hypothetical protein Cyan7822_6431 [Gloeothece verrucosa PCC 7822]
MKYSWVTLLSVSLISFSPNVIAGNCPVFIGELQDRPAQVNIYPGLGVALNFIPIGTVQKIWLDDPSRIVLSFDGNLCSVSENSNCSQQEGATVVHLRQIKAIEFPNIIRSADGSTMLTVIVSGGGGRNLYQFRLIPTRKTSNIPPCTTFTILPDSYRPTPQVFQQSHFTPTP